MLIHNILDTTSANGPGNRTTIWTQGCTVGCPGCTNPQTWSKIGGKEMSAQKLVDRLKQNQERHGITGFTMSGGEPLEQFDDLFAFLRLAKDEVPELDVLVFSGRYIEQVKDYSILNFIDIFIDGPFVASKLNYDLSWRGSENQRIFLLNDSIREKMKSFYKLLDDDGNVIEESSGLEVILRPNGEVETTGFGPVTEKSLKKLL